MYSHIDNVVRVIRAMMVLMEKWAHQGSMVKPENQAAKEEQVWKTMQTEYIYENN